MFDWMKSKLKETVDAVLADRAISISQNAINTALAAMVISTPELTALSLNIHDGNFDLLVEGKKVVTFKSRIRFEITSCEISTEKQLICFRRISPAEITVEGFLDRILLAIFSTLVCRIFQIEPASFVLKGQPGFTVQGDSYTVDLSQTDLSAQITPQIESILNVVGSFVRVKELRCTHEKIEVLIGR
ncbi:MAG: hypothetical protein ACYCY8_08745 [Burkholderiales bacterium]